MIRRVVSLLGTVLLGLVVLALGWTLLLVIIWLAWTLYLL